MFSLFSNEEKGKISILIDIQSGLVRGALVLNKGENAPHILYITTQSFTRKIHVDSTYITKTMLKSVAMVINSITNDGLIKIQSLGYNKKSLDSIHFILSSPWVISKSKLVKIQFENETKITEKMISDIIIEEQNKLKHDFGSDLTLTEQKIFEIKFNGYVVNNFEDRKAKTLEISFATTLSPEKILNKIHLAVSKNIHIEKAFHHSALLLHFLALQSLFPKREDFVSVHIHGELTDIIVVRKGVCACLASFPFGVFTLLRKVSYISKHADETSDSILSLYQGDKLEDSENKKVKKIIEPLMQTWYHQFLKSITKNEDRVIIPRLVYLSAHSHFDIFKSVFILNNEKKYEVISFNTVQIESHVTYEKISEKSQVIGMYALALKDMI